AVSRSTVVAAYASLREDALVASRQGSGTWVDLARPEPLGPRTPPPAPLGPPRRSAVFRELLGGPSQTIELLGAHLPAPEAMGPELLASCAEDLARLAEGPGYLPAGVPQLRRAIAAH